MRMSNRKGSHLYASCLISVLIPVGLAQRCSAQSKPQLVKIIPADGEFPSSTPRYRFADTLAEQEAQLAVNPLMRRFAQSRKALASDPYRPAYHFVSPEIYAQRSQRAELLAGPLAPLLPGLSAR